jgi:hypothetical protein
MRIDGSPLMRSATLTAVVLSVAALGGCGRHYAPDPRSSSDASDIRQAVEASHHPQSTAKILRGTAHGVAMFDADADLKASIVKWLAARLSAEAAADGR